MTRSIYRSAAAAIAAAVLQFPSTASADVADQKNDECLIATELISYIAPVGQTFKPTQGLLIAAELELNGMNGKPPVGDVILNVRSGGALDGTILGTATVSGVTLPRDAREWARFEFVPPIAVTPEVTYTLEFGSEGTGMGIARGACGYDRGQGLNSVNPSVYGDYNFRTYGPCGNGSIDAGEECDDGKLLPDGCCDGACQFRNLGIGCASDCGSGTCNSVGTCLLTANFAAGTACTPDSTDLCTQEECNGSGACVEVFEPAATCETAGSASLSLTDSPTAGKDKVKFKWSKANIDYGTISPLDDALTNAALCVYGNGGLILSSPLPSSLLWAGKYGETTAALTYKDKDGMSSGVTGAAANFDSEFGKSGMSWQAGGTNLTTLNLAGPVTEPVVAQLLTGAGGCYGAQFDGEGIKKNADGKFKGVAK